MTCSECKYWAKLDSDTLELGFCRINSPTINATDVIGLARWPKTKNTDWCGDFWANDDDDIRTLCGGERRSATLDY